MNLTSLHRLTLTVHRHHPLAIAYQSHRDSCNTCTPDELCSEGTTALADFGSSIDAVAERREARQAALNRRYPL